ELDRSALGAAVAGWRLERLRSERRGVAEDREPPTPGTVWRLLGGDVVSAAPELARMTLTVAVAHHDARASGRRLVYGGQTIGIAASQLTRALPQLATIVAWHGCDHTGPVMEGDTLSSEIE